MENELVLIEGELKRYSAELLGEFKKAEPLVEGYLSGEELSAWAREGAALAGHSFRSWEAAAEYFRAAPRVLEVLDFPTLIHWVNCGRGLAELSADLSSAYFRVGPKVLPLLHPAPLMDW